MTCIKDNRQDAIQRKQNINNSDAPGITANQAVSRYHDCTVQVYSMRPFM